MMTMTGARAFAIFASLLVSLGPMVVWAADRLAVLAVSDERPSREADLARKNFGVGFIRPASPYDAYVSPITGDNQTTGNRRMLGKGDQVFLELRRPHEVAPGDLFTVYRRVKKVYHPVRGHYLGDLTAVIGVVKVLRVTGNKATVRIERSFEAMFPGDEATRQVPSEPVPAPASQAPPQGAGMIIELPPGQTLIGEGSVVYVDWGRNDGVKIGDRLQVFRENIGTPIQSVGELQIVAVEDQTATARIVRSYAPILRGDRVAAKATIERVLGSEAPPAPRDRKEALFQEMDQPSPADPLPGGDMPASEKSR